MRIVHFEIPADDPARAQCLSSAGRHRQWDGPMDYWMIKTGAVPGVGWTAYSTDPRRERLRHHAI